MAILLGFLTRSTGPLQNGGRADVWVAARHTQYIDIAHGLNEQHLYRVRTIPQVAWAVPFLQVGGIVEVPGGAFAYAQLLGLDHATLIGQPPEVLAGNLADLRLPDTVLIDTNGVKRLPGVQVGSWLKILDRQVRVVGICRAYPGMLANPLLFATTETIWRAVPRGRLRGMFLLVKLKDPHAQADVCRAIDALPDLQAFPAEAFRFQNARYTVLYTAVGANFGVTVVLGLVVGLVLSLAAFHQFTSDNLPHYALLKAVGTSPRALACLVLGQALTAGLIGYGIGIGLAGLMVFPGLAADAILASRFPWQLMVGGLVPMLVCVGAGGLFSLWRVLRVDPVTLLQ
jgi:putative ABC transport system permease protein